MKIQVIPLVQWNNHLIQLVKSNFFWINRDKLIVISSDNPRYSLGSIEYYFDSIDSRDNSNDSLGSIEYFLDSTDSFGNASYFIIS